ncbi:MAG: YlbF family regulator [Bacillota bacterium]
MTEALFEKARELGAAMRDTEEFQKLAAAEENMNRDLEAQALLRDIQEAEQTLHKLQQSGLQPTQEQMQEFQGKREQMSQNAAVSRFMQAQAEFTAVVQEVNGAISEGMKGEDADE